jgi:hypothetical protein
MFRSAVEGTDALAEVRTADLFVERSEEEVDARARGLGRPLVVGLLESAIETDARRRGDSPDVQRWFREMLRRHSADRARRGVVAGTIRSGASDMTLTELRSQYESYRLDQVAHLIALLQPADFREIVEVRLEGRRIDFNSRDRLQHAMSIVQDIEWKTILRMPTSTTGTRGRCTDPANFPEKELSGWRERARAVRTGCWRCLYSCLWRWCWSTSSTRAAC